MIGINGNKGVGTVRATEWAALMPFTVDGEILLGGSHALVEPLFILLCDDKYTNTTSLSASFYIYLSSLPSLPQPP